MSNKKIRKQQNKKAFSVERLYQAYNKFLKRYKEIKEINEEEAKKYQKWFLNHW